MTWVFGDAGVGGAGHGIIGYRYAPRNGGFTFRIAFTPLFNTSGFYPSAGLVFGGLL